MKYRAFTLAEVLITLGIIGVVATMTIPTLIHKIREAVIVNKVKKANSILNQAYLHATDKCGGDPTGWGLDGGSSSSANKLYECLVLDNIKVSIDCAGNANNRCFTAKKITRLDGSKWASGGNKFWNDPRNYSILTSDGMSMYFTSRSGSCTQNLGYKYFSNSCGAIGVDIDGPNRGPFAAGIDVFYFFITPNGIFPSGGPYFTAEGLDATHVVGNGQAAAWWVINKENINYLNCYDKLNFTGKNSCK